MERLSDIQWDQLTKNRTYTPSPGYWEDLIIYFLMVDRFSDGRERGYLDNQGAKVDSGTAEVITEADIDENLKDDQKHTSWLDASEVRNGGTLKGVTSKIGYLKRLGITAIWISPVFKQPDFEDNYHGYGIQNFLQIDPRIGTSEDLRELVETAHDHGLFVVMDIIVNHTGNVFTYDADEVPYTGEEYPVKAFNAPSGAPEIPPDSDEGDAVRPRELQRVESFTRKGSINDWDAYPEYVEGDFYSLKNIHTGSGKEDAFQPSEALKVITQCYKYWIAFADIDGYRLDTVKHIHPDATRYFINEIHEYAHTLGKDNFYLIGEITGGFDFAVETQQRTGLNAAIGLNRIPEALEQAAKGYGDPGNYFGIFKNSPYADEDENRWYRNNVITMFDDHDMVSQSGPEKSRFCADRDTAALLLNALCMNIFTMGIPCIYYGTEQAFDGQGDHDKFVRETMFGGTFGAFRTSGKHCFREDVFVYREFSKLASLRQELLPLRYGRQYIREISYDNSTYEIPEKIGDGRFTGVYGWSRIYSDSEVLVLVNTDLEISHQVWAVVDADIQQRGDRFIQRYLSSGEAGSQPVEVEVQEDRASVKVSVPAGGCALYERVKE